MSNDPSNKDIPASKAVFDTHTAVRIKMEAASRAIHEAVVAMVAYRDPMAPIVFNATWEQLEAIANAPRSKLNHIFMTGVPTFSLRMANDTFHTVLSNTDDQDAWLRTLLETFSAKLPIASL
jgi:protein-disulfide isomerase-like protein with CxxC motif